MLFCAATRIGLLPSVGTHSRSAPFWPPTSHSNFVTLPVVRLIAIIREMYQLSPAMGCSAYIPTTSLSSLTQSRHDISVSSGTHTQTTPLLSPTPGHNSMPSTTAPAPPTTPTT